MGRKKRKIEETASIKSEDQDEQQEQEQPAVPLTDDVNVSKKEEIAEEGAKAPTPLASSGYAMTSHSGEIIQEDIYVSDGSEGEDEDNIECVLAGSRMGIMRRGLAQPSSLLVQPNRQWTRGTASEHEVDDEEARKQQEEEELAKLDPAQRAARLLQEKQRREEEAKEEARRMESEENAGRDPTLFSKRTAFDIRFDQIEDKPWTRGTGDLSDYFNYSLTEETWLEYAQHQLEIRQELIDASKQKRSPDPNIVPVQPRAPTIQQPRVAVVPNADSEDDGQEKDETLGPSIGPEPVKKENEEMPSGEENETKADVFVGSGGAWGAGAPAGSYLAKLIEEQEASERASDYNTLKPESDRMSEQADYMHETTNRMELGVHQRPDDYYMHGNDYYGHPPPIGGHHNAPPPSFPPPPLPPPPGHRAARGGRGFPGRYGGRSGRGSWDDRSTDYYGRKRPREDRRR